MNNGINTTFYATSQKLPDRSNEQQPTPHFFSLNTDRLPLSTDHKTDINNIIEDISKVCFKLLQESPKKVEEYNRKLMILIITMPSSTSEQKFAEILNRFLGLNKPETKYHKLFDLCKQLQETKKSYNQPRTFFDKLMRANINIIICKSLTLKIKISNSKINNMVESLKNFRESEQTFLKNILSRLNMLSDSSQENFIKEMTPYLEVVQEIYTLHDKISNISHDITLDDNQKQEQILSEESSLYQLIKKYKETTEALTPKLDRAISINDMFESLKEFKESEQTVQTKILSKLDKLSDSRDENFIKKIISDLQAVGKIVENIHTLHDKISNISHDITLNDNQKQEKILSEESLLNKLMKQYIETTDALKPKLDRAISINDMFKTLKKFRELEPVVQKEILLKSNLLSDDSSNENLIKLKPFSDIVQEIDIIDNNINNILQNTTLNDNERQEQILLKESSLYKSIAKYKETISKFNKNFKEKIANKREIRNKIKQKRKNLYEEVNKLSAALNVKKPIFSEDAIKSISEMQDFLDEHQSEYTAMRDKYYKLWANFTALSSILGIDVKKSFDECSIENMNKMQNFIDKHQPTLDNWHELKRKVKKLSQYLNIDVSEELLKQYSIENMEKMQNFIDEHMPENQTVINNSLQFQIIQNQIGSCVLLSYIITRINKENPFNLDNHYNIEENKLLLPNNNYKITKQELKRLTDSGYKCEVENGILKSVIVPPDKINNDSAYAMNNKKLSKYIASVERLVGALINIKSSNKATNSHIAYKNKNDINIDYLDLIGRLFGKRCERLTLQRKYQKPVTAEAIFNTLKNKESKQMILGYGRHARAIESVDYDKQEINIIDPHGTKETLTSKKIQKILNDTKGYSVEVDIFK